MVRASRHAYIAPAIVTGWALALLSLGYRMATHRLGANPIATLLNQLGLLSLVLLVASLSCTPLKLMLGITWPMRVRRTLGLLAFFTAFLHFAVYLGADQGFNLSRAFEDILKRPFIAVGFLALTLLVPLAWTSSKKQIARLGFPLWKRLHLLVYPVALLVLLHFYWRVKADHTLPLAYLALVLFGFGVRLYAGWSKARTRSRTAGFNRAE